MMISTCPKCGEQTWCDSEGPTIIYGCGHSMTQGAARTMRAEAENRRLRDCAQRAIGLLPHNPREAFWALHEAVAASEDDLPETGPAPDDVARCMPDPNIALCADCIDAYRNGIEPGGTACEERAHGNLGVTTERRSNPDRRHPAAQLAPGVTDRRTKARRAIDRMRATPEECERIGRQQRQED